MMMARITERMLRATKTLDTGCGFLGVSCCGGFLVKVDGRMNAKGKKENNFKNKKYKKTRDVESGGIY